MRRLIPLALVLTGCASHHAQPPVSGPPTTDAPEVLPLVESRVPYQSAPTTVAPTTTHTHPTTTAVVPLTAAPPVRQRGVWAHLVSIRSCESGGNYGAVSSSGKFRGAYQFSRSTWDWVARSAGHSDLVSVDPAAAAPADQDAMAHWLYVNDGPQHWPECRYA